MNGQISIFDLLEAETPNINDITEAEAVRIVGERLGVQFKYNSFFEEWQAQVGKMELSCEYSHFSEGINDGRLFLGVGWRLRTSSGGRPCDGINETVRYFKNKLANVKKYEADREDDNNEA